MVECDLQVATPAWRFTMPADRHYDLAASAGRQAFAASYVEALVSKGIEVVAVSDHNTGAWVDDIKAAAKAGGLIAFPGCEVTTGSGADGVHIVVIGAEHKTSHDIDLLLASTLGFDHKHPRYRTDGSGEVPASSGKTILQILNDLPDDYLVIAPHALNQNGIASENTARGDIRWKALHHQRLGALDPGDCSSALGESFNDRFRRRSLDDFPALQGMAFVSTSDAYRFEDLGRRFCWIRMETPSLEALRQAFLDHEARIICDWDPRLAAYEGGNR
jgi:PHP family Zn ribbon phosphoesterase